MRANLDKSLLQRESNPKRASASSTGLPNVRVPKLAVRSQRYRPRGLYGRANTLTGLIWRLLRTSTSTGTRSRMSMKQIITTPFEAGIILAGDGRSAVGVKPALMLVP